MVLLPSLKLLWLDLGAAAATAASLNKYGAVGLPVVQRCSVDLLPLADHGGEE
jgi:hypothetical protein